MHFNLFNAGLNDQQLVILIFFNENPIFTDLSKTEQSTTFLT